ncbi:MAG: A/G-specific adenine glycosylase, partial [Bacteroidetes bacterium]|nr:A/G-specific adenine glycosylase [Bacteroidota bacterium]
MDLGGRVCVSRKPKCEACPISRWCRSRATFEKSPR